MNFKITKNELQDIKETLSYNPIYKFLKNRDLYRFSIGDILIKKEATYRSYGDDPQEWVVETVSDKNAMPRRYVYVYEDPDTGIGFIKRLKISDGELGDQILCMSSFSPDRERFELDPLFVDSVLLGDGNFDIKHLKKIERQRKKELEEFNKQSAFQSNKISEINSFLSKFKAGDTLYTSSTSHYLGIYVHEVKIDSIKEIYISSLKPDDKENFYRHIDDKEICDSKKVFKIVARDSYGNGIKYSFDFLGNNLFATRPKSYFDRG